MKRILTIAVCVFLSVLKLSAQYPQGGAPAGGRPGGGNAPAIGHVYGKVVDSADRPVAQASVVLLQSKFDSTTKKKKSILLKGTTTNSNGEFSLEQLPLFNSLQLKISSVGLKEVDQSVIMLPGSTDKDLGNLKMFGDVNQLQNVTVTTSASALKMDIDKKTFNVDKNIVSAGGTAVDVMKNVPSVQVDIDGNVKVRNASPQIYVDGRPTTLTLDQIPADAIQSVEVITNPSAKYDASGGNAGILNIVLKKDKKTGYNGNLMAGVDSRGGINGGGNFSIRQGKVNLSAAVNYNQRKGHTTGFTDRTYIAHDTTTNVNQNSVSNNNGEFLFGKVGLDYYITNRTTLSVSGIKVHGEFKPGDVSNISTDSIIGSSVKNLYSDRLTNSSRTFNGTGATFGMVHNFPKDGHQLTADANYFGGKNTGYALYTNENYDADHNFTGTTAQQQLSSGNNKFITIQTDYTNPLTKTTKLEAGLRAQINSLDNITELDNKNGGVFEKIPEQSIDYKNTNNVFAAYTTITSAIKNFGYEVGLRAESSTYKGDLLSTGEHFSNNYPISLFPSVFLSQKLGGKQELQANFSRRINRPNFFQLIPYTDRTDSLNITRGNPNLVPEFTNSFELSYSKTFKKNNTFLASIYYKHTTNLITRFLDSEYNSTSKQLEYINTYINANSSYSYGAELTTVDYITKWWDLTANINVYNSKINIDSAQGGSQPALISWFGKLNNNFKLPANFSIQLSGNYQSKTNLPVSGGGQQFGPPQNAQSSSQGYIKPFWFTDVAIKKTFLKNQAAAVTLSFSDIFRTRINEQISFADNFYQDYYRLQNPQLVRINFSYRFGKMDMNLFKRQSKSQGVDASQMGGTR